MSTPPNTKSPSASRPDWIAHAIEGLPALMTAHEAAAALRCSRRTLGRLAATGQLQARRAAHGGSSRLLVPREALAEYLARLSQ